MNIGFFIADSNGAYSVPSAKGGAVSSLVEHLVERNNIERLFDMHIITFWDEKSLELSRKYQNIIFHWIKIPLLVKSLDRCLFYMISHYSSKKAISYKSVFSLIWYILKSKESVEEIPFDCIVLENNILLSWLIKISGYKGRFIYHLHNIPRLNAKCSSIFRRCNIYLCVSDFVCQKICANDSAIGRIPVCKTKTFYNCIDTEIFRLMPEMDKTEWKYKFDIPFDAKVILFVGRLSEEKGIDKLLKSVDFVKTSNVYYLIVGNILHGANDESDYTDYLKKNADKNKKIIRFTGFINSNIMPYLYNLADISVLPSMWDEPAGLTMIESIACGTPVISTKSGGIPEYVGDTGILLDRDAFIHKRIAHSIDELLNNEKLYSDLSEKGIKRIRNKFSKNIYLDNFYKEIVKII